jgi:hypothetical protein
MDKALKTTCGAKNRQGEPCKKSPMKGKQRCRNHGGRTPTGTKGNRTHGLYSAGLTDEERDLWDGIQLGNVDDELRLCRIQLRRAMNLELGIQAGPNDPKNMVGVELVEIRRTTGNGKSSTDAVSKRVDTSGRVNWLLGRIGMLEKTRSEGAGDVARDLVDTLRAMKRTELEQKPPLHEPEPNADV